MMLTALKKEIAKYLKEKLWREENLADLAVFVKNRPIKFPPNLICFANHQISF